MRTHATTPFYGMDIAKKYGYTAYHFKGLKRGLGKVEGRLQQLFGPAWSEVKLSEVEFVEKDRCVNEIALANGCRLVIAADKYPPAKLLHSLDLDLVHEYSHALLINRSVLERSLTDRQIATACVNLGRCERESLHSLSDPSAARVFMWSLVDGINNPFVSGLQSEHFQQGAFGTWVWNETHNDALSFNLDSKVLFMDLN